MTPGNSSSNIGYFLGADGIVVLVFFFFGLISAWWALAAFKWDKFFNQPLSGQVQLIRFFLAITGGILAVMVAVLLLGSMQILRAM